MKTAVVSVILNSERSMVLLVKRRDVPVWVLPGGGIDQGEKPSEAAIRESLEETGLHVVIIRQIAEYTPLNRLSQLTYVYECRAIDGVPSTGEETRAVAYFPLNKLPHNFFFLHLEWLEDALKNNSEVIHRAIDKVTYFNLMKYLLSHPIDTFRFALSRLGFPLNSKNSLPTTEPLRTPRNDEKNGRGSK